MKYLFILLTDFFFFKKDNENFILLSQHHNGKAQAGSTSRANQILIKTLWSGHISTLNYEQSHRRTEVLTEI